MKAKTWINVGLVLCLIVHLGISGVAATVMQEAAPLSEDPAVKKRPSLLREFLEDEGTMWSTPGRIHGRQWLVTGAVLLTTSLFILHDEKISHGLAEFNDQHPWARQWSSRFTSMVSFPYSFGWAGLFLVTGLLARDTKARDTGLMAIAAILHCNLLAQPLKLLSSRQRPYIDGRDHWYGLAGIPKRLKEGESSKYNSFPSGHSITAWSLATVISEQYRTHFWVGPLCYALAALVGLSRVTQRQHWVSDVFIGAALGFVVGKMVVRNHRRHRLLVPAISATPDGIAIGLSF